MERFPGYQKMQKTNSSFYHTSSGAYVRRGNYFRWNSSTLSDPHRYKNKTADVNKNYTHDLTCHTHTFRRKKAFCRHPLPASMSVEAALVVPLLFFGWMAFVSLISVANTYERIQHTLTEVAVRLSVEAGKEEDLAAGTWLQQTWLQLASVEGLESGGIREVSVFDFSGSEVPEGENWICLSVRYRVLLLEGLIPLPAVRMKNQAYIRAWTGYAPGENTEEVSEAGEAVYVTDSGRVYHSNRMCSHIKLSIFMVDGQKARKYPPCEKCVGNAAIPGNTFYLTEDGACYHSRLSCSGLKRSVRCIGQSEAVSAGYMPCQRCGGE